MYPVELAVLHMAHEADLDINLCSRRRPMASRGPLFGHNGSVGIFEAHLVFSAEQIREVHVNVFRVLPGSHRPFRQLPPFASPTKCLPGGHYDPSTILIDELHELVDIIGQEGVRKGPDKGHW